MHTMAHDWNKTVLAPNKSSGTGKYVFTRFSRPKKMGTELIFVPAVPQQDHRRPWSCRGMPQIINGSGTNSLHERNYPCLSTFCPNRSIFCCCVNNPLVAVS